MKSARSKVVPIHKAVNNMVMDKKKLLHSSLTLLDAYLRKRVPAHFVKAEEVICDVENSYYSSEALSEVEALKDMKQRLSTTIIEALSRNILDFLEEIGCQKKGIPFSLAFADELEELSLLPVGEVENKLLLEAHISTCEKKVSKQLHALIIRLESIAEIDFLKESSNPFGPSVLLNTYADLMQLELFSKKMLDVLYQCFCDVVLSDLGDLLDEINQLFINAGVIPKIPIKKSSEVLSGNTFIPQTPEYQYQAAQHQQFSNDVNTGPMMGAQGSGMQGSGMQGAAIEPALYGSLQGMAKAYRASSGEQMMSDGLLVSGEQLATGELLSTLTSIQKTDVAAGADVGLSIRSKIGEKLQVDGQRQPYTEQDDTLIDVVAMFFDVILQDRQLPDVVRAMIAQLQIPVLKVAMMDKEFFAKKSHPARKFLNVLSQAGLGACNESHQVKSAVFEKMEEMVARVLMEFDDDVEVFSELFEEFDIFMEQQQRQIELIEERSRKVTKSTEQLELTKRQAAYEIALRLNGKPVPEFVQSFLDNAWKDVLVLALLRREREPAETDDCLNVIERLIVSVIEPADDKARAEMLEGLARLLKDIRLGLEDISYDFYESAPFFKELESWHRHILMKEKGEADIPLEATVEVVDFDEELSLSLEEGLLNELESDIAQMPDDKFSKKVHKMEVGDWVEYKSTEGATLRAKLSWKSAVTMQCLFVNERGVKAMDISMADFADELRQKRMVLVGQEKAPLVERVLEGMKKRMIPNGEEPSLA